MAVKQVLKIIVFSQKINKTGYCPAMQFGQLVTIYSQVCILRVKVIMHSTLLIAVTVNFLAPLGRGPTKTVLAL